MLTTATPFLTFMTGLSWFSFCFSQHSFSDFFSNSSPQPAPQICCSPELCPTPFLFSCHLFPRDTTNLPSAPTILHAKDALGLPFILFLMQQHPHPLFHPLYSDLVRQLPTSLCPEIFPHPPSTCCHSHIAREFKGHYFIESLSDRHYAKRFLIFQPN